MKICLIGAGVVGTFVAERLARDNHEIAVVDKNPAKLEKLSLKPNILTLNCDAESEECLRKLKGFELFVVLTDKDEVNLTVAAMLRALYPSAEIIVRTSRKDLSLTDEVLKSKSVDIVEKTAQTLQELIKYPFANNLWRLKNVLIFRKRVNFNSVFLNKPLKALHDLRKKVPFAVVLIKRRGEYLIPHGDAVVKLDDVIYLAVEENKVDDLVRTLRFDAKPVKDLFVLGYSKYADRFLEKLNADGSLRVKFIHPDYSVCDAVSKKYKNVFVFQGEPTDDELLRSEGVERADYVFCLGDGEEHDIVLSIFVTNLGAKRTCVLIKHPQFENVVETLKVHSYVLPKKIVASHIYSYLREKNVVEVLELEEGVEIFKLSYEGEAEKVKNLRLKDCKLIIAVERNGVAFIPTGETIVEKGDYLYCLRTI
jgi:trk system potassium uptake protein TrkA